MGDQEGEMAQLASPDTNMWVQPYRGLEPHPLFLFPLVTGALCTREEKLK